MPLTAADLAAITAAIADVRGDRQVSVVLRRGGTNLDAQLLRVEQDNAAATTQDGESSEEARRRAIINGPPTLDIQKDDRFTVDGALYRVTFVDPNRTVATIAEAETVE